MALFKCTECGHEISTQAKRCPNCGARNKAYKSKLKNIVILLAIGFVIFFFIFTDEAMTNCDTYLQRKSFASVIDNSSYSQLNKIHVVEITNIETIDSGEFITDLVCDATVHFNNSNERSFRFTWRESESGSFIIQAKPK